MRETTEEEKYLEDILYRQHQEEQRRSDERHDITRDMALDAGDPTLEGGTIGW